MAREYGRYLTRTHRDEDWAELTTLHHDCYMALVCSEDITWAGVVPYAPLRFSSFASDLNERRVTKAWAELEEVGLLVIDKATAEILVRTFLKHDNVIAKPNLTRAFCTAYEKVRSDVIRRAIDAELGKLYEAAPNLSGWGPISERLPDLFDELQAQQIGA